MSRYQTRQQHLPRLWEGQVGVDTEKNEKEEQMFINQTLPMKFILQNMSDQSLIYQGPGSTKHG